MAVDDWQGMKISRNLDEKLTAAPLSWRKADGELDEAVRIWEHSESVRLENG